MVTGAKQKSAVNQATLIGKAPAAEAPKDDESRFGEFGGQFIPETLSEAFREISVEYKKIKEDPEFQAEVAKYRKEVRIRSPLRAPALTSFLKKITALSVRRRPHPPSPCPSLDGVRGRRQHLAEEGGPRPHRSA